MKEYNIIIWSYVLYVLHLIKTFLNALFQIEDGVNSFVPLKNTNDVYIEKHLATFLNSYKIDKNWNSNIECVFYSKEKYVELLKDEDNGLEKQWKTRVLIEHSPRGNIFMYYDPYKLGFVYYCDNYVPYNILNAIAMKYVLKFHCRDFFMDEVVSPEPSPLLNLVVDEKKEKGKEKDTSKEDGKDTIKKNAPFAKFKNYHRAEKKENLQNVPEKQKERNKFVYLGKTSNFSILQRIQKKTKMKNFKSNLASSLFDNSDVQKEVFDYRKWKMSKKGIDECVEKCMEESEQ